MRSQATVPRASFRPFSSFLYWATRTVNSFFGSWKAWSSVVPSWAATWFVRAASAAGAGAAEALGSTAFGRAKLPGRAAASGLELGAASVPGEGRSRRAQTAARATRPPRTTSRIVRSAAARARNDLRGAPLKSIRAPFAPPPAANGPPAWMPG